jgi:hypothetical protein
MVLNPRHRADCFDLFTAPQETNSVQFQGPQLAIAALERDAARAGRTWNAHLCYVLEICRGAQPPDFDDPRSVEDWRAMLGTCEFRCNTAADWSPFTCLWKRRTP